MSSKTTRQLIELEQQHGAHNKAEGVYVWDPEGRRYFDFLSAYSAVNQGHSHPAIIEALVTQAKTLALSSRAFYNDVFGTYAKYVCDYFNFDMVLPMNTGAEAVETAIKLARKWAYLYKKVPADQAIVLACTGNFHGRTIGVISMSTDPDCRQMFGPFLPQVGAVCPYTKQSVEFNNYESLEKALTAHGPNVAAFLVEPIQGEAGIFVPDDGYLKKCYDLCKKHNVLFIADEIQTGLARTGKMLAIEYDEVKPDILILGKALSGGIYPVSAVLASKEIMMCIKPGQHGSTYGGNPLGCAVAIAALKVLKDEKMCENAMVQGERFRNAIRALKSPLVQLVRGKGLLNAIVIDESKSDKTAWHICLLMKKNGLLAKPTHQNIIRLAPPLCITSAQIDECVEIISHSLQEALTTSIADIPDHDL